MLEVFRMIYDPLQPFRSVGCALTSLAYAPSRSIHEAPTTMNYGHDPCYRSYLFW